MRERNHNSATTGITSGTGLIARLLLAAVLLFALAFNPIAMRAHMANASPASPMLEVAMDMSASPHADHQQAGENICPQMAPCTAVLSGLQNLELTEVFLSRLEVAPEALAKGLAPAPPFHPPIA